MNEPTEAQLRAVMVEAVHDIKPGWVMGKRLNDIPAMMFAVRTADVYALVLQRASDDRIELAAMTRDGNVVPLVQDVKFPDEEVKK